MIQLTTPVSTGDLDEDYTHVRINRFTLDRRANSIQMDVELGYLDGGEFVVGQYSSRKLFEIHDYPAQGEEGDPDYTPGSTAYTDLVGGNYGHTDVLLYDDVSTTLYQWLIDNGHYAGSIV